MSSTSHNLVLQRTVGSLAVLLGIILLYSGLQILLRTPALTSMQVFAHRGGAKYAPENTLAAFRTAIAQGVTGIEFDVQMTSDGALVVIHDATVDRTTNGTGAVRDLTLDQIRSLDAGSGEKVPTFEEVLQMAKTGGVTVLPETKSAHLYPGIEQKILAALDEAGYSDHAVIQSFEAASLKTLRGLDRNVRLCALYGTGQFNIGAAPGDAQFVCPEAEMVLLDLAMIRQAHLEGRQVIVWFLALESPRAVNVLRFFGVDGVIVNDPAAVLRSGAGN